MAECPGLTEQLAVVRPSGRRDTGGGFSKELRVEPELAPPLSGKSPVDNHFTDVEGMRHPLGLILFQEEGYLSLLEGCTTGDDETAGIDVSSVQFAPTRTQP